MRPPGWRPHTHDGKRAASGDRIRAEIISIMIQVAPQMRMLLAVQPADFRKGIDGLSQVCRKVLSSDPFSGYVFIFRNKRATAIKMLMYDGQGFWLCQKRLSKGRFEWWPDTETAPLKQLAAHELNVLIWNGDFRKAQIAPLWKPINRG
jgi:transposase